MDQTFDAGRQIKFLPGSEPLDVCYRSLSTMLPAPFSIKQLDGNATSLGRTPLRSVTSSLHGIYSNIFVTADQVR